MSFIVNQGSNSKPIDPIPTGMHQAVCYSVIDIGTQPQSGKFPSRRKVMFGWEVPEFRIEIPKENNVSLDLPRAISERYTLTLASKGNLRPMLESWRGQAFTDNELEGFDLSKVLGANCFINIIHNPGKGQNAGKIYANVASVNPLVKGTPKLKPENPTTLFFMDDFSPGQIIVFPDGMPEWIQKLIMQSEEYQAHLRPQAPAHEEANMAFDPNEGGSEDDGSNVPF